VDKLAKLYSLVRLQRPATSNDLGGASI